MLRVEYECDQATSLASDRFRTCTADYFFYVMVDPNGHRTTLSPVTPPKPPELGPKRAEKVLRQGQRTTRIPVVLVPGVQGTTRKPHNCMTVVRRTSSHDITVGGVLSGIAEYFSAWRSTFSVHFRPNSMVFGPNSNLRRFLFATYSTTLMPARTLGLLADYFSAWRSTFSIHFRPNSMVFGPNSNSGRFTFAMYITKLITARIPGLLADYFSA